MEREIMGDLFYVSLYYLLYFYNAVFYSFWELAFVAIATVIWLVSTYFFIKRMRDFLKRAKASKLKAAEKEKREQGPIITK